MKTTKNAKSGLFMVIQHACLRCCLTTNMVEEVCFRSRMSVKVSCPDLPTGVDKTSLHLVLPNQIASAPRTEDCVGCKRCESACPTDFLSVRVYLGSETTRSMGLAY